MNLEIGAKCLIVLLVASLFIAGFTTSSVHVQSMLYGARVDNIRFRVIKSLDAATEAMKRGDVDILTGLRRPVDIEMLNREGKKILATPGDQFWYITFNMRPTMEDGHPSPFGPQDGMNPGRALRHAIAHMVPKAVCIGTLLKYIATLIDAPMSAAIGTFGADVDPHSFDMIMAENILLDAGFTYTGGVWYVPAGDPIPRIELASPSLYGFRGPLWHLADTIVRNMRSIGMDARHVSVDPSTLMDWINYRWFDMCIWVWRDMGRFGDHLYDFFHSNNDLLGGDNHPGLRNNTLDGVTWDLYTTLDIETMQQKAKEALELLCGTSAYATSTHTDGLLPYIPIYSRNDYSAYDSDLVGIVRAKMKGSWNYWTICNMHCPRTSDLPIFDPGTKTMAIFTQRDDYQYPANPAWVSSTVTWNQLSFIYDSLIGMNPYNLRDKPGWLDLSRDPSPDTTPGYNVSLWTVTDGPRAGEQGMKVDFYLNTTVTRKWHDGHDWDAWDVAFAWEYLTANKIPRAWSTFRYLHHTEVNHPNNDTVTAYMTTTSIVLPYDLSEWSSMFPEHVWGCTHGRGGRAVAGCGTEDRENAWNAELSWINSGDIAGSAGTKPGTDADAGVESGLCLCAVDPAGQGAEGKLTCEHGSGCVLDDRTTDAKEILGYNPAGYAHATDAYPWLTEQIGTGPYVFYDIDDAAGIGNLIVFDERTHATVQSGVHYPQSVDEMQNDLTEYFWESGDANLDGQISISDMSLMSANFMMPVPPAPWRADINQDGWITMRDISAAAANYGEEREH